MQPPSGLLRGEGLEFLILLFNVVELRKEPLFVSPFQGEN